MSDDSKITRRSMLAALGVGVAGAALAACAPQPTPTEAPAEEPTAAPVEEEVEATAAPAEEEAEPTAVPEPAEEPVTITWWGQWDPTAIGPIIEAMNNDFYSYYPHITVDFQLGGAPGGGDFIESLLARIAAGNPPDGCVLWTPPVQFAARGSLLEIDDLMASARWAKTDSFYGAPLKSCQWRGKTFGLPASASCTGSFYNKSMLEAKGISTAREDMPKTWDELKALSAEFVVYDGDMLTQVGTIPWTQSWMFPLYSQLNGGILYDDAQEKYSLNSEANVEWLNFWLGWLDEQYRGDVEAVAASGSYGYLGSGSGFALQTEVIQDDGVWGLGYGATFDFPLDYFHHSIGSTGEKTLTAWWPNWYAIPSGSPHPNEAWLYVELSCTVGWNRMVEMGGPDFSPWADADRTTVCQMLVDTLGAEQERDVSAFFNEYLKDGCIMWNSPIEDFATATLAQSIDEVLHKVKPAEQALSEAQALCEEKLQATLTG